MIVQLCYLPSMMTGQALHRPGEVIGYTRIAEILFYSRVVTCFPTQFLIPLSNAWSCIGLWFVHFPGRLTCKSPRLPGDFRERSNIRWCPWAGVKGCVRSFFKRLKKGIREGVGSGAPKTHHLIFELPFIPCQRRWCRLCIAQVWWVADILLYP